MTQWRYFFVKHLMVILFATLALGTASAHATCFGVGQPEPFLKRIADEVDLVWLPYTDQVFVTWSGGGISELSRFITGGQKDVFGTFSRLYSTRAEARAGGDFVITVDRISGEVVEVEDRDGRPLTQQSCASDWILAGG